MTNVLVLGASGQIARQALPMLAAQGDTLTLLARTPKKVDAPEGARVVEGDVLDADALGSVMQGQDAVYANLAGDVDRQAEAIISAMDDAGVRRLVFVLALGIYDELPEPFNTWNQSMVGPMLKVYRRAADMIEASDLDYTIVRPTWLTDRDEIDYQTTPRGEQPKGTEVSRKSVAALVAEAVAHPDEYARTDLAIDKPGTEGPKPSWY
ncbi:NAD-dependent dehydratase [Kocuria varians]|uniref:NAD-dependent dehydratase n=1 Tax=Kocuria varians TaxID=1272 RepID=A0A4Y4D5Z4_KOCVA|nr:NAD(P)H-binding protein [Kocuria varians]GEC99732.1 NAD-dependent dehydratase [Kocuria varians]